MEVQPEQVGIDICIVCALAEEAQVFLDTVSAQCSTLFATRISPRYRYDYRFATIQNNKGESLTLHVSWLPRYGPQEMTLHLSRVLEEFQPRFTAMIGICAGDKLRVTLGDLIVAERTFTYDAGKFERDEHGRQVHQHDTTTYQLDENILRFVHMFDQWKPLVAQLDRHPSKRQQREWLLSKLLDEQTPSIKKIPLVELEEQAPAWRRIVHELQRGPDLLLTSSMMLPEKTRIEPLRYGLDPFPYTDPPEARCHIKPMASGSAVRSDDPFKDIQVPVRGTVAIDMEGAAFCRTMASFPGMHWLIVKGVSDYADSDKDDSYHHYASAASARYLLCFIREYVTNERMPRLSEQQHTLSISNSSSREEQPTNYHSCFISHAGEDQAFAEKLYADLQSQGVHCWFAPEDLKIGDKVRSRIDETIQHQDKLLLVLSAHSVASAWVEKEVETAFEVEQRRNNLILFPIRLDDAVIKTTQAWAADIRRMCYIGDFTRWTSPDAYQKALSRLLRDLKIDHEKTDLTR